MQRRETHKGQNWERDTRKSSLEKGQDARAQCTPNVGRRRLLLVSLVSLWLVFAELPHRAGNCPLIITAVNCALLQSEAWVERMLRVGAPVKSGQGVNEKVPREARGCGREEKLAGTLDIIQRH